MNIPAEAGIQGWDAGFRVSRCSPGMTGCHERRAGVGEFVSEQPRSGKVGRAAPAISGGQSPPYKRHAQVSYRAQPAIRSESLPSALLFLIIPSQTTINIIG